MNLRWWTGQRRSQEVIDKIMGRQLFILKKSIPLSKVWKFIRKVVSR